MIFTLFTYNLDGLHANICRLNFQIQRVGSSYDLFFSSGIFLTRVIMFPRSLLFPVVVKDDSSCLKYHQNELCAQCVSMGRQKNSTDSSAARLHFEILTRRSRGSVGVAGNILKWNHAADCWEQGARVSENNNSIEFSYLHNGLMIYSLKIKRSYRNR